MQSLKEQNFNRKVNDYLQTHAVWHVNQDEINKDNLMHFAKRLVLQEILQVTINQYTDYCCDNEYEYSIFKLEFDRLKKIALRMQQPISSTELNDILKQCFLLDFFEHPQAAEHSKKTQAIDALEKAIAAELAFLAQSERLRLVPKDTPINAAIQTLNHLAKQIAEAKKEKQVVPKILAQWQQEYTQIKDNNHAYFSMLQETTALIQEIDKILADWQQVLFKDEQEKDFFMKKINALTQVRKNLSEIILKQDFLSEQKVGLVDKLVEPYRTVENIQTITEQEGDKNKQEASIKLLGRFLDDIFIITNNFKENYLAPLNEAKKNKLKIRQIIEEIAKNVTLRSNKLPNYTIEGEYLSDILAEIDALNSRLDMDVFTANVVSENILSIEAKLQGIPPEYFLEKLSRYQKNYQWMADFLADNNPAKNNLKQMKQNVDILYNKIVLKKNESISAEDLKLLNTSIMQNEILCYSLYPITAYIGKHFTTNQNFYHTMVAKFRRSVGNSHEFIPAPPFPSQSQYVQFIAQQYSLGSNHKNFCAYLVAELYNSAKGNYMNVSLEIAVWQVIFNYENRSTWQKLGYFWRSAKTYGEWSDYLGTSPELERLKQVLLTDKLSRPEKLALLAHEVERIVKDKPHHPLSKLLTQYVHPQERAALATTQLQSYTRPLFTQLKEFFDKIEKTTLNDSAACEYLLLSFCEIMQRFRFAQSSLSGETVIEKLAEFMQQHKSALSKNGMNKFKILMPLYAEKMGENKELLKYYATAITALFYQHSNSDKQFEPTRFKLASGGQFVDLTFIQADLGMSVTKSIKNFMHKYAYISFVPLQTHSKKPLYFRQDEQQNYYVRITKKDYEKILPHLKWGIAVKDLPGVADVAVKTNSGHWLKRVWR